MIVTQANHEGWDAYHAGVGIAANPRTTSDEWDDWEAGWQEARDDEMADAEYDSHQY